MTDEQKRFQTFISGWLVQPPTGLTADQLAVAIRAWTEIVKRRADMIPPIVEFNTTGEGILHLCWNSKTQCLSLEIYPSGNIDWFYKGQAYHDYEGTEDAVPSVPPRFYELAEKWMPHGVVH